MPPTLSAAFGEVLRELREKRGMSQEALSFACGRHRTYVSLLERGRNSPSLNTLWMLAEALEVTPSEFVRRIERRLRSPRGRSRRA
ncbi:MAG: helix-turn-helix domain-containing protein [Actinomycetota bacterium]